MAAKNPQKIVESLVYPDRAYVTRWIKATFVKGKQSVTFSDLPPHINRESINVSLKGTGLIKLESVDLRDEVLEEIRNEQLKKLESQLKNFKSQEKFLQAKIVRIAKSRENLRKIRGLTSQTLFPDFYHGFSLKEDFAATSQFFLDSSETLDREELDLTSQKMELTKKLVRLQQELGQKKAARYKKVLHGEIFLDVIEAGDFEINFSYMSSNCSWSPIYDVRVFFDKDELELSYYGEVTQLTGEDWSDVELYLSTANPSIGASLPELTPQYLTLLEAEGGKGLDNFAIGSGFGGGMPGAQKPLVQAEEAGLNVNFHILKKEDLPSDGSSKKVLIAKKRFPLKLSYQSVPKNMESVFAMGTFENNCEFPFLAGPVKVFHGNDYIGDSALKTIVPGEDAEISLGIDEGLSIKRELVNRYRSKKGVTGQNLKFAYFYRITLKNYKESDLDIQVFESLPVSKNKEIKVKIEEVTDKPEPDDFGLIQWKSRVPSSKEKTLVLKFTLEYPASRRITGLDI